MRAQLEKKRAQKDKEKNEEYLRKMAQQAREERAGIKTGFRIKLSFYLYLSSIL